MTVHPWVALPLDDSDYVTLRERMIDNQLRQNGIYDSRVLEAMASVPRHRFVPEGLRHAAYADTPLPIGFGQTISQPLMVAIMLQAAELEWHERVLDIGTGSGYQAALLSRLVHEVVTIEIVPELADQARSTLAGLGARNVTVIAGDGSLGWPASAPYNAILVAAGAPAVPEPLVEQLTDGGRLIIPVGGRHSQMLQRIVKTAEGVHTEDLDLCAFVPLVGKYGVAPH